MFKRKKKIDLHGFEVITTKKDITITDDKKLWSVLLKKGTAWHTSLEYQLKNDLENAKRLISILWVTEIMLSDTKCMKDITKAVLNARKVLYSDNFTFIPNDKKYQSHFRIERLGSNFCYWNKMEWFIELSFNE